MDWFTHWMPWMLVPALVISVLAQLFVQFVLVRAGSVATKMSGYAVARHILDGAGKYDIQVEQVPGAMGDHFDASRGMLQLTDDVYHGRSAASMAFAAHEASHALQNMGGNRWLMIRELAVAAVTLGSGGGVILAIVGLVARFPPLLALGIFLFSATVYIQLLSLPIELHASRLALRRLVTLGIVEPTQLPVVRQALVAAGFSYVGATLQSILTLCQRLLDLFSRPRPD